jgi:hypothetical protein
MTHDERVSEIKALLFDHVRSPSLRHIRDPYSVARLAQEIAKRIDRGNSIWQKWDGQREVLARSAMPCWIPIEDLRDFLNAMPGPHLTSVDVAQRMRAFEEEDYFTFPKEELQASCAAIYSKEKGEGTELPAIIGLLRDHVEHEEERLRSEQQTRYAVAREQDREKRELRLLSGADCGWTRAHASASWFCRANGRTYRLSPTKDKMWHLHRVSAVSDDEATEVIGKYRGRREATKAVATLAYQPEPRWQ